MDDNILITMLLVSLGLGLLSLIAFLWGLKNNQFEDQKKSMNSMLFDSEDDLNDMAKRVDKQKKYEEKRKKKK
jgi:cbb3-type cytochrome oxidase maturation protein